MSNLGVGDRDATSCMNAVDTNILVYAICADEPAKSAASMRLLDELTAADTVLLWQVACELGAVLTRLRASGRTTLDAAEAVQAYRGRFPLVLPSPTILNDGLRIHLDDQVSYWDAMLLAACADAGVKRLNSEDLPSRSIIRGVEVFNPIE